MTMSVKWHFASMAPIPSHATAFRSYIVCVNSRLISRLQSYIFACCSNRGCIYYLIPLDIHISPSEPPFHLAMSNTLAQEIHLTIQTLQSSLTALQSLQQKHNSNGSVHLPLCMKTVDLDVRTRLHKLQHDAQFVPELMEQLTAHFAAMAISVCHATFVRPEYEVYHVRARLLFDEGGAFYTRGWDPDGGFQQGWVSE
jgi:hypothetical protein